MSAKFITLITGANQGIGFHAAHRLAASGQHIILLGSRDLAKGQAAVEEITSSGIINKTDIEALALDLDSDASIQSAAETVEQKYGRLDILINNAGINGSALAKAGASLREQFHAVFNTNVFGAAVVTDAFLPLLRQSTIEGGRRIVFVSSSMGALTLVADPGVYTGPTLLVYPSSKTADNALTVFYGNSLGAEGFTVVSVCPGYCDTNLTAHQGFKNPRDGAEAILIALREERERVHLKFVHDDGGEGRYPW